jgi:hypothetical protein
VTASLVSSTRAEEAFADVVAKIGEAMNVWSCDPMTYVPERDITVYVPPPPRPQRTTSELLATFAWRLPAKSVA